MNSSSVAESGGTASPKSEGQHSDGAKVPSDHLLICIPSVESGLHVTVKECPGGAGAAMDAFFEAQASGLYAEIVAIYRHHGKGPLDEKWWAGAWNGYGKRHEALFPEERDAGQPSEASTAAPATDDPKPNPPTQTEEPR